MTSYLEFEVTLDSPLHIGGDIRGSAGVDKPMVQWDRRRRPFIPATTVKGRLRHELEALVLQASSGDADFICEAPLPYKMCKPQLTGYTCPICELFGSPWQAGTLIFTDLTIKNAPKSISLTSTRTGTRMNRRRSVVEDEALYSFETTTPGLSLSFSGAIEVLNENIDLAPLYAVTALVQHIGGIRSRGLGWCHTQLFPAASPSDIVEAWDAWLDAKETAYVAWLVGGE